jgi:hypothetical protein
MCTYDHFVTLKNDVDGTKGSTCSHRMRKWSSHEKVNVSYGSESEQLILVILKD